VDQPKVLSKLFLLGENHGLLVTLSAANEPLPVVLHAYALVVIALLAVVEDLQAQLLKEKQREETKCV